MDYFEKAIDFGVVALQTLAYQIKESSPKPLSSSGVRVFGMLQNVAFVWGFVALVVIVICN